MEVSRQGFRDRIKAGFAEKGDILRVCGGEIAVPPVPTLWVQGGYAERGTAIRQKTLRRLVADSRFVPGTDTG